MFPDLMTDDAFRLETSRLWLRWPRIADAAAIVEYAGDEAVSKHTERLPHPYSNADAEAFILACRRENAAGRDIGLALTRKAKPTQVIGMIGVHARPRGEVGVGYWLGAPFWGQGLMGEALDEILALTFAATAAEAATAIVRKDNRRSRGLLASRGFEQVEDRLVNMPLRGGVFPCGKFRLERGVWQGRERERFRRAATTVSRAVAQRTAAAPGETKLSA